MFGDTYNSVYNTAVVLWAFLCQVLADGFTATMPDTPENQEAFPQQKSQKPGDVAVFDRYHSSYMMLALLMLRGVVNALAWSISLEGHEESLGANRFARDTRSSRPN